MKTSISTSSHRTRMHNDIQYEMMFIYYLIETNYTVDIHNDSIIDYYGLRQNYFKNRYHLKRMARRRKQFICVNDVIENHHGLSIKATQRLLISFYQQFFPAASAFEKIYSSS